MAGKVKLCGIGEVPPGQMLRVDTEDGPSLAVFNLDGNFYVTSNVCTHGVAMLTDGWFEDDTIECPQHGGAFDVRTGEATAFPCEKPLRTYEAIRAGDDLFVDFGERDERGAN